MEISQTGKRFPVNRLKIYISFTRDMLSDRNNRSIVGTIIAMGRSMELETLAEGVGATGNEVSFGAGVTFRKTKASRSFRGKLVDEPVKHLNNGAVGA